MLRKDHLRVSRAGGAYTPQFVSEADLPLAERLIETFREHVGDRYADLQEAVTALEADADDFKLVRGLASLLERETTFETRSPLPPQRARRSAFEAAESIGVATAAERERALQTAASGLGVEPDAVDESLYADREDERIAVGFEPRWDAETLLDQYNLSLAQTALFDATDVRVRSADPKRLVTATKRLGLLYELERTDAGRELVVTGPDTLFRRTRRYGTAFARLLRSVAAAPDWTVTATIDDRGTERTMTLTDADVTVPGVDPVAEPSFDSGVEADFAGRFRSLDLDWTLVREPEPLETGTSVMIPDFAFEYDHADFRVFFEVMGFWTPEYVSKKLSQLESVESVDMLVAVDDSLGVGEEIAAADHRVVTYSDSVRVKDVVDVLREYESDLLADAAATLPDAIRPTEDVIELETIADRYGVGVDALSAVTYPDHERLGGTLVRPSVLEELEGRLEPGMRLEAAEDVLRSADITETSPVLSRLGYRTEWEGLSGGTIRPLEGGN
ncbi:DUF790 family protein [Halopenitus sp. POP-27]|uniref:DUF790 family protein n=1 Tax=Halopenitus sp. POP-27 TaxID=2994425 RepID=UPI002469C3F8|nr:DUF790 family protein [Halopenitus sp. POP-27]